MQDRMAVAAKAAATKRAKNILNMHSESISHGALKNENEHRRDVCTVGYWFHQRGFVAATDGNISLRLGPHTILASPTGISKGMMSPDDLVVTDLAGGRISGQRNPSSELAMHLLIYRRRPEVNAVCHAHPPTATGYAAAGLPLNKALLSEAVIGLGCVPLAEYGTPGTSELTESIEPFVQSHDAILMANHGVVTYGTDLLTAFYRMETVEHFARVALVTELLHKQVLLSGKDVEKLLAARVRYGLETTAGGATGCLVTSDAAEPDRVTLTRRELETLVEEAVKNDRARR
ncbi:MAG TPA: class II aldolase/adducin family protein [Candidatus Acidoferrales bacterium]|nr:class II aldolase/adducin family protein [Candidatus Acidoferrales bacterium]